MVKSKRWLIYAALENVYRIIVILSFLPRKGGNLFKKEVVVASQVEGHPLPHQLDIGDLGKIRLVVDLNTTQNHPAMVVFIGRLNICTMDLVTYILFSKM